MTEDLRTHWDAVYTGKSADETSWFEGAPTVSLRLIDGSGLAPGRAIDVGAGRSELADALLTRGWTAVTVLDLSEAAVAEVIARVDDPRLSGVVGDVLIEVPDARVDLWHDRAVLHFLTDEAQRRAYADVAARTVVPGGIAVVGCFGPEGPEACSGLPVRRASAEDLASLFAPAFTLEHAETVEHTTPWDSRQSFTWVVLRRT